MTSPDGSGVDSPASDTDPSSDGTRQAQPAGGQSDRSLGRRGWLLVAAVVIAFIGVPLAILYRPPALPFFYAYLALPLLPAFLLALLAVWAALPRSGD